MSKKSLKESKESYLTEAITCSKQLGYPEKIRLMLRMAKSDIEIGNIMAYARHMMSNK